MGRGTAALGAADRTRGRARWHHHAGRCAEAGAGGNRRLARPADAAQDVTRMEAGEDLLVLPDSALAPALRARLPRHAGLVRFLAFAAVPDPLFVGYPTASAFRAELLHRDARRGEQVRRPLSLPAICSRSTCSGAALGNTVLLGVGLPRHRHPAGDRPRLDAQPRCGAARPRSRSSTSCRS